ncbi:DUF4239 domain-containing protein [Pendulispora rubella]|uniref:DUF4239 domain-containing protein n=1 Tax=Pendulispora rubella TaxID=2741070 RepID=A0ABZ2L4P5_9BACT
MDLLWIYTLPDAWFCTVVVLATVIVGVAGLFLTRGFVRRHLAPEGEKNELVSYFLAAIGVFYGITLGLIAVGTWQGFADVQKGVSDEAAKAASLYRDLSQFPEPERTDLRDDLRDYTKAVIQKTWPALQRGETPKETTEVLVRFIDHLGAFEPKNAREQVLFAEVQRELNEMNELRRKRIEAANSSLPGAVWAMVYAGAILNIAVCWLFVSKSIRLHATLVGLMSALIGFLLFVTLELDRPFRGDLSIPPDAFQLVLDDVMTTDREPRNPPTAHRTSKPVTAPVP